MVQGQQSGFGYLGRKTCTHHRSSLGNNNCRIWDLKIRQNWVRKWKHIVISTRITVNGSAINYSQSMPQLAHWAASVSSYPRLPGYLEQVRVPAPEIMLELWMILQIMMEGDTTHCYKFPSSDQDCGFSLLPHWYHQGTWTCLLAIPQMSYDHSWRSSSHQLKDKRYVLATIWASSQDIVINWWNILLT